MLHEFAEACQQERERATADKRRQRAVLENKLSEIKRQLDQAWSGYLAERLPAEIIGAKMRELSAQQKDIEADLATAPEATKVVGLHPGILRQYETYLGHLEGVFAADIAPDAEEAAERISCLVSKVCVTPQVQGLAMRVEGRLSELLESPNPFPTMRMRASGGSVVAEEGLEPPTRGL